MNTTVAAIMIIVEGNLSSGLNVERFDSLAECETARTVFLETYVEREWDFDFTIKNLKQLYVICKEIK